MKNRAIKFRAWVIDGDIMVNWKNMKSPSLDWYFTEKVILMQYTGMKDSKGKEIYEGDILRQKKNKGAQFKVYFDKDGKWMADEIGESFGGLNHELWSWAEVTEVIGNIHSNPELLKV